MYIARLIWTDSLLASLAFYLLIAPVAFTAGAPMVSQLALYQGVDRERMLIEGAKREGAFTLYD